MEPQWVLGLEVTSPGLFGRGHLGSYVERRHRGVGQGQEQETGCEVWGCGCVWLWQQDRRQRKAAGTRGWSGSGHTLKGELTGSASRFISTQ